MGTKQDAAGPDQLPLLLLYSAAQVPAGLLADRVGHKLVLVPGYLLHGVGAAFSGLATGYPFFLGSRMLTGLSQGTYFATQYAITSAEVPVRFRAVASAITMSGRDTAEMAA